MSNSNTAGANRLAAVILARDAAASISESVASAWKVADQVLVVDMGSRDTTADLTANLGATLFDAPQDDRAAAKNLALQRVAADWILWLEQGEVLADETVESLREFLAQEAASRPGVFDADSTAASAGPNRLGTSAASASDAGLAGS